MWAQTTSAKLHNYLYIKTQWGAFWEFFYSGKSQLTEACSRADMHTSKISASHPAFLVCIKQIMVDWEGKKTNINIVDSFICTLFDFEIFGVINRLLGVLFNFPVHSCLQYCHLVLISACWQTKYLHICSCSKTLWNTFSSLFISRPLCLPINDYSMNQNFMAWKDDTLGGTAAFDAHFISCGTYTEK